jgi:ribonuclease HI
MAKEKKYYVVWQGRKPGVYENWADCKAQIDGFPAARYKGFPSAEEARNAYRQGPPTPWSNRGSGAAAKNSPAAEARSALVGKPIQDSICVDAACNSVSGLMEYQGLYYKTGGLVFKQGPYRDGTNNIGEFLAIVHALGYCDKKGLHSTPIYSDSRTAIGWVKYKRANTKLEPTPYNTELFDLIKRAEQWLRDHSFRNAILKWETKAWGENPADFGRK